MSLLAILGTLCGISKHHTINVARYCESFEVSLRIVGMMTRRFSMGGNERIKKW